MPEELVEKEGSTIEFDTFKIKDSIECTYYKSVENMTESLELFNTNDVFYNYEFNKALEAFPPDNTFFRYVVLKEGETMIGFLYFQIKKINLGESLSGTHGSTQSSLSNKVRKKVSAIIDFYTLVNGNMLQTGNYGRYFIPGKESVIGLTELETIVNRLIKILKGEGFKIAGVLLKDFFKKDRFSASELKEIKYQEFSVQPTMSLDIPEHWENFDNYLGDLKSKYKVRTRRTLKKLEGVEKRTLDLKDLEAYEGRMHELYKTIATQASFNLFILNPKYFIGLKLYLKDKIEIVGYFLDGLMVGFYTIIYNGEVLDAHFLGYDSEYNRDKHLYHNMLYDLLKAGIKTKKRHIDFSRTAMEIKSSIGAKPEPMYLYLKIVNPIMNLFNPKVLKFLTPTVEWKERNPFKDNN